MNFKKKAESMVGDKYVMQCTNIIQRDWYCNQIISCTFGETTVTATV